MAGNLQLSLRINADGSAAITSLRNVRGEVDGLDRTARGAASGGLGALGGQLKSLAMTAAAGIGIAELGRAFIAANVEADRLAKGLTAVTGSSALAAQEMAYIRDTANQMGQSVTAVSDAYLGLTAATKGTALQGQATRDIFEAVSLAMGKLGKSSADTQGALLALQQMVSKGTVSMEELNGQLGERLPGALKAAADGMGVTTEELVEMVSQGKVLAVDLLPALSRELRNLYDDGKAVGGLEAEWNRLTNAMGDLAVTTDQATGATGLLAGAIQSATALARDWEAVIRAVSNAQRGLGFAMGERDELAMLYRERTQLVNEYLGAVERANQAGDLSKTPGLAFARDEALAKLAQAERSIQAIRGGLQATAAAAKEAGDAQARSMGDDAVKLYEEQRAKIDEANQSLLKLNSTYDDTAKRQYQVAEATKQYQEIAKSLGKDEAWVSEQVAKYTASLNKSTQAKGGAAKASKTLSAADRESAQAVSEAERAVQSLIDRYLPARAAAEDYAEAQAVVAAALAGKAGSVSLSAEEADKILAELGKEQAKVASEAAGDTDAFADAWKNVVDSLDDTFQGLWRSLITGQGDVLGNLKETVLEWVADLSYQLLLSPLVVPIQTALLGGTGAAVTGSASGMVSGAGSLGGVGNLFSSLSSGMSWFSTALSSVTSGAIFSGISTGFGLATANIGAAGYFGAMGTTLATAGSSFASGAIGTGIGMAAPYLLPAIAAIAAIAALSGAFTGDGYDHEPGYWGVSTGGTGVDNRFRGGRGVSGGFGLSFGVDAASTDEFDWDMWPEYEKQMAAMADMSQQLATFYGEDVAKAVEKALSDASGEGLLLLTHEFSSSFVYAFDRIIAEAAKTGDDLAVVMEDVFSGIVDYTSMDTYATSIQEAMVIAQTALAMADDLAGTAMGDALELTGEVVDDAKRLADYGLLVRKEGEGAAEAFVRMATQLAVLDQAVQQTATDLSGLTAEGVLELSTALVDAFGSLDAATQAQAFYYDQFTTQTEKLVDAIQAAAKAIDREIPKLQDELMKLSKDVITEVIKTLPQEAEKTRKAVDDLLRDVAGGKGVYAPLIEGAKRWIEDIANLEKSIEAFYSLPDNGRGRPPKALLINDLLGKVDEGLVDFGDTLRRLGFDVDNGAEAFLESLKRIRDGVQEPIPSDGGGTVIDTITTPGDPNAAILAKLLDDLPKTREGFNELIGGLKLTDEASRKLYAGLMKLLPQFDLLYDGVEAFTDWLLGVDEVGQATRTLERVFKDWGMTLPENRDALKDLYDSGILTTEQMAILGAYLKELGLVFGDLKDDVDGINELDLSKLRDAYAVLEQAARAEREAVEAQYRARMDAIAAEREALDKQYQARMDAIAVEREALDAQHQARLAAIANEREAVDALYRARVDAIAAEREAVSEAYRAQSEALAKQAEVAREALSAAEAGLSRIQSALDAFRGEAPRTEMERLRALRQLGAWAASGRLPDEDSLDRAITGASNLDAQDFTSEASYRAAQGSAYSALLALEKVGVKQVSDAERQIAAIETASERAQAAYDAQLKALDDQADQAAAWRDAQLEILARQQDSAEAWREAELARLQAEAEAADAWREAELARLEAEAEAAETWREENLAAIDALLALAAKQIAILEGTYVETKSLAEALKDFNAALIDAGGEPLSPTQAGLDALLPPMTELVAASTATTDEVVALRQEIVTLRRDLAEVSTAQVVPLKAIDERLRKWDLDGLPGGTDSTSETALRAA